MMGTALLILVAIAYSAAVMAIGRRLPRPASVTASVTALVILVAVPLLPDAAAQRVDRVVQMVGAGRLLVHLAFMTVLCGLFVTVALATNRWAWRQQLAVGGAGVLMVLFVVLWWHVQTLPLPDVAALFYGIRAGHPTPVLWMNVVMGAGIVYIAACGLVEFQHFMRAAGIPLARGAMARMAASLITFRRDNVIQDPSYGLVTSWDELMEDAAAEIDQVMAATAWEQALRDSYVSRQVYILMFLVLESREYREILLVNERPRIQAWHQHLADLIATVMHEHGHSTPRYVTLARSAVPRSCRARIRTRLASRWGSAEPVMGRSAQDEAGHAGGREPTT